MKENIKCYCGHTTTCDCGTEEPEQETLEEAAEKWIRQPKLISDRESFIAGAKWNQERSYSEEDMKLAFTEGFNARYKMLNGTESREKFIEQFRNK